MNVNMAGTRKESYASYHGRTHGRSQGNITFAVTVEIRFVMSSYRFANYHLRLFAQFNLLMNPKCSMLLSTTADFLLLML